MQRDKLLLLVKLYNLGCVLACSSVPCRYFLSKTLFFQTSTPTIFRSPRTLAHRLSLGLPFGLFSNVGIQLVIFLVIRCSSILCICPNHPSLFAFICLAIFCFRIILSNSSLFRNLHDASGLLTGP
jgi:hypothetical protein